MTDRTNAASGETRVEKLKSMLDFQHQAIVSRMLVKNAAGSVTLFGTDIARAVRYAEGLVENPARTMIVLITDLFEGGSPDDLVRTTRRLVAQGVKFVTLAALDAAATPTYDRELGQRMVRAGASVGAMTPFQLVEYLKGVVK